MKNSPKDSVPPKKADPQRRMAYKSLPPHIKEQMTPEEVELFLYAEAWPDTLMEKMAAFIVPLDEKEQK